MSVRRLNSLFPHSGGLVDQICRQCSWRHHIDEVGTEPPQHVCNFEVGHRPIQRTGARRPGFATCLALTLTSRQSWAVKTLGVDLSAEPDTTGLAVIEWHETRAEVVDLRVGSSDAEIVETARGVEVVGIDCPFGWPESFRRFLGGDDRIPPEWPQAKRARTKGKVGEQDWRRWLAYRRTDYFIREHKEIGIWPLSVASDKIALTAMRAQVLLNSLKSAGRRVEPDGSGDVVEVYPAAALKRWRQTLEGQGRDGLTHKGYKGSKGRSAREGLVQALFNEDGLANWLAFSNPGSISQCYETDDALDAVICALIAAVHASGQWQKPRQERSPGWTDTDAELAAAEGWIIVPDIDLPQLPQKVWAAGRESPEMEP